MRTSLNEIAEIEKYLFQNLPPGKNILFQAKTILDRELNRKVLLQKKIYDLVKLFHRDELKKQAEEVFSELIGDPERTSFKNEVFEIFKKV